MQNPLSVVVHGEWFQRVVLTDGQSEDAISSIRMPENHELAIVTERGLFAGRRSVGMGGVIADAVIERVA